MSAPFRYSEFTLEQGSAIEPDASVWVTASAGTGKTHVLSARVLRLLLEGVAPENILCVTYTRAAAAEMAQRIFARLADYIRIDDVVLTGELKRLGVGRKLTPDVLAQARTLFARTLDAPGGLKIQTIHSFCQSLLGRFPLEAKLAPGFTTLTDRTATGLARAALDSEIARAASASDRLFQRDFATLALNVTDDKLSKHLADVAAALDKAPGGPVSLGAIEAKVFAALGLPLSATAQILIDQHSQSDGLETAMLRDIAYAWGKGGKQIAERALLLEKWLAQPSETHLPFLYDSFLTKKYKMRAESAFADKLALATDCDIREKAKISAEAVLKLRSALALLDIAGTATAMLRVAWQVADTIAGTKQALGFVSYDDLIQRCVGLLGSGAGDWVRYKLDSAISHVLVDEAQDTNAAQWEILKSLTAEYFVGASAREVPRSIFAVGDFKQAIFRFQGSDPNIFIAARSHFSAAAQAAQKQFVPVPLATSFRSAPAVIDFVNSALGQLADNALGAGTTRDTHSTARAGAGGRVSLWPLVEAEPGAEAPADDDSDDAPDADDEPDDVAVAPTGPRAAPAPRLAARQIARQIAAWTAPGSAARVRGRPVVPGDIMVLVQNRLGLARALVADLKMLGVPVAGIDRLELVQQLAVRDLLACARFALQPDDDLNLAALLKSPLVGWSDADVYAVAQPRSPGTTLWSAVRDGDDGQAVTWLQALLAQADFVPPYDFLSDIYDRPGAAGTRFATTGRARLFARLGSEIDDPVIALLDLALAFEAEHAPSLQAFVAWIEEDTGDLKREADAVRNDVRIMTVHGAKGLQAKIVILADAHAGPKDKDSVVWLGEGAASQPVWLARKASGVETIDAALAARWNQIAEDYWRLFYVAITRAEDHLVVAGWQLAKSPKAPRCLNWHELAGQTLQAMGATPTEPDCWGAILSAHAERTLPAEPPVLAASTASAPVPPPRLVIPDWALQAAPHEPVPPRPLSPSRLGGEAELAAAPLLAGAANLDAPARGSAVHRLLELLPAVAPGQRAAQAIRWLAARGFSADDCQRLALQVCTVLDDPAFATLFGPGALAEVPVTALLGTALSGDVVLSGTIDRLLVTPDQVMIVDYKTSAVVPASPADVPLAFRRQLAAYRAALQQIYPGRPVACALLWTHTPLLMPMPDAVLDAAAQSVLR